jgi:NAD(P)H dehydrogenase (quinone)
MILITGATGQVGRETMNALVAAGAAVRALVRNPSSTPGFCGVQVVQGNFDDDVSLARALDGINTMLLVGRDNPDTVPQQQRVLARARRANVQHIVKLSAIGASADSPIALMREHHAIDKQIQVGPASWTLLKPHLYMQNLLRAADAIQRNGRLAAPMGRDRFPFVDTRDVGAAAAIVLGNPVAHTSQVYALTGPVAHTYDEVATALSVVAGRTVTYEPISPQAYEARLLAADIPSWRAFDLAHITSAYSPTDNAVWPDLPTLLGHKPRSISEFLQDHRDFFTGTGRRTTNH